MHAISGHSILQHSSERTFKTDMNCRVTERSFIARIAAWKLSTKSVAIVIGNTIHLHNATREEFLRNPRWVRHELTHVRQFAEHGFFGFIAKYLVESIKHGYRNNKY